LISFKKFNEKYQITLIFQKSRAN